MIALKLLCIRDSYQKLQKRSRKHRYLEHGLVLAKGSAWIRIAWQVGYFELACLKVSWGDSQQSSFFLGFKFTFIASCILKNQEFTCRSKKDLAHFVNSELRNLNFQYWPLMKFKTQRQFCKKLQCSNFKSLPYSNPLGLGRWCDQKFPLRFALKKRSLLAWIAVYKSLKIMF